MTPDLRDLFTRVRNHLRATSPHWRVQPPERHAAHLGPQADGLAGEIEAALARWPATTEGADS